MDYVRTYTYIHQVLIKEKIRKYIDAFSSLLPQQKVIKERFSFAEKVISFVRSMCLKKRHKRRRRKEDGEKRDKEEKAQNRKWMRRRRRKGKGNRRRGSKNRKMK